MDRKLHKLYYNKEDLYLTPKIHWQSLNESKVNPELIRDFPINVALKFDKALMIKAIQYGMIIMILYRGEQDRWAGGRSRVICPLNYGRNLNTQNDLIRGWHLDGWSVSMKHETKKVWRLFKTDNIKSMTFVGDFFRLPPAGYKVNDRVMSQLTYIAADFNVIRRNQFKLIQQGLIEDEEETQLTKEKISSVEIKNTDTTLSLDDPWSNSFFDKKNQANLKISFVKSVIGNKYLAILGAQATKGSLVKLYENKKLLGSYRVVLSLPDPKTSLSFINQLKKYKIIETQKEWVLYSFVKKL
jgi:hypothetical protein